MISRKGKLLSFAEAWLKRHPGRIPYEGPEATAVRAEAMASLVELTVTLADGREVTAVLTHQEAANVAREIDDQAAEARRQGGGW